MSLIISLLLNLELGHLFCSFFNKTNIPESPIIHLQEDGTYLPSFHFSFFSVNFFPSHYTLGQEYPHAVILNPVFILLDYNISFLFKWIFLLYKYNKWGWNFSQNRPYKELWSLHHNNAMWCHKWYDFNFPQPPSGFQYYPFG